MLSISMNLIESFFNTTDHMKTEHPVVDAGDVYKMELELAGFGKEDVKTGRFSGFSARSSEFAAFPSAIAVCGFDVVVGFNHFCMFEICFCIG